MEKYFGKEPEYWNWLVKNELTDFEMDCDTDSISRVLAVYERAEREGCITEQLACQQINIYLQVGKLEKARELVEKLCTGKLSNSVDLWVLRISMEISNSPSKDNLSFIFGLLKKVLSDMNVSKAVPLWRMAFKIFAKENKYLNKLFELSMTCLIRDGGSDDGFSLSSAIIELFLQMDGIHRARDKYYEFLGWQHHGLGSGKYFGLPRPGLVFYKKCIEMETNLAITGDREGLLNARKLYEKALATYEQDVDLWQHYYTMEIKMGTSKAANDIYLRAKKQLKEKVALLSSANL